MGRDTWTIASLGRKVHHKGADLSALDRQVDNNKFVEGIVGKPSRLLVYEMHHIF
jgi:hypothetical protein